MCNVSSDFLYNLEIFVTIEILPTVHLLRCKGQRITMTKSSSSFQIIYETIHEIINIAFKEHNALDHITGKKLITTNDDQILTISKPFQKNIVTIRMHEIMNTLV